MHNCFILTVHYIVFLPSITVFIWNVLYLIAPPTTEPPTIDPGKYVGVLDIFN